ncbi:MAG TPA: hypothetical protein VGE74_07010 [Gemmata sp.]
MSVADSGGGNHGQETVVATEVGARTGRRVTNAVASGEYYCVSCPFCHDTRHRLEINHRWAEFPWMAHCFNETQCLSGATGVVNRVKLKQMVFGTIGVPPKLSVAGPPPMPPEPIALPAGFTPLSDLPEDHEAVAYLKKRGFDPAELAAVYGVGYCGEVPPEIRPAANRIFIPVTVDGALAVWQARAPRDSPQTGFGADPFAKYWNSPGFGRTAVLYGADAARPFDFVVVCEGATDVWKVGPPAVGLLSKTATLAQKELLVRHWGNGTLVVLLDADAEAEARRLAFELGHRFRNGAVIVRLPRGTDPGMLARGVLWGYIWEAGRERGLRLVD